MVVLSRGESADAYTPAQQAMDTDLADRSPKGTHRIVEGADHFTLVTNREYAQAAIDAIREVVEAVP